jgi:integrase/recombinase XerD
MGTQRCACPMWVEGTANETYVRRSLKTASWERATGLSRIIEESDKPAETPERKDEPVTIVQAVTEYLADAKARELADATLYKLETQLRKQFLNWCKKEGYKLLKESILEPPYRADTSAIVRNWNGVSAPPVVRMRTM